MSNTDAASTTHLPDTTPTVPSGRPVATDVTEPVETTKELRAQVVAALRARDQAIDAQTSAEATVATYARQLTAQAAHIDRLTRVHAEEQRRAGLDMVTVEKYEAMISELTGRLDAEGRISQGLREVLQMRTAQLEAATRQLGLRTERDLRDTADTVPA